MGRRAKEQTADSFVVASLHFLSDDAIQGAAEGSVEDKWHSVARDREQRVR